MPDGTLENTSGAELIIPSLGWVLGSGDVETVDELSGSNYTWSKAATDLTSLITSNDVVIKDKNGTVIEPDDVVRWANESPSNLFIVTFNSNTTTGQPVYVVDNSSVDLADYLTNPYVIGLALDDTSAGNSGRYTTEDAITLSNWTTVTGSSLLVPGAVYFLGTAGTLTANATSTPGNYVVAVGRAASETKLDIEIAEPILLC